MSVDTFFGLFQGLLKIALPLAFFYLLLVISGFEGNKRSRSKFIPANNKSPSFPENAIAIRLLKILLPCNEQENVIGDLIEEYLQFQSTTRAYFWLYKQIITSALSLFLRAIREWLFAPKHIQTNNTRA